MLCNEGHCGTANRMRPGSCKSFCFNVLRQSMNRDKVRLGVCFCAFPFKRNSHRNSRRVENMARRARSKQKGVIGTLFVEVSALMGILGIAQPSVRNNLWSIINPPAAASSQTTTNRDAFTNLQTHPLNANAANSLNSNSLNVTAHSHVAQSQIIARPPQSTTVHFDSPQTAYGSIPMQTVPSQTLYPPTYTAQATVPYNASRPTWRGAAFNPMGGFQ